MNKNNQFVKKIISWVMVLAVLLPLLAFPVSAVNPQKKSLIDRGQLIPDNEEADVNLLMMSPDFVVESILVTSALEQMPSREELKKDTENLINTFQYGLIDGEKIGSVFLYVNRVPSTGKVQMAVVPTMKQEANYTNYQVDFMERTLQEVYEKAPDIDILIYNFMSLLKVYYYPVINEMGANFFTDDVIQAASEEIVAWRKKYQQNIVLLLNHGFPDGLYDKYADDYFISQGYGIGENNSGVFLIFDDKTGRFDIRFYGTANKGFTQEQLQGLVDEIALKLEGYDVLAIVHIIERFLEPNESIPLVNLDANPNPEEHVDNPELEFPEFRPAFYVVNNQNVLSPEDEELLGLNASAFRFAAQANFVTIVFHPEEMTKDEMQTAVESMYEKWYGEEDGIAVFFDQMSKEIVYHTVGSMKELYNKNKEEVDNLLSVLEELTKENDFSAEDIVFYQQSLMELLYTLYAEQQDMAHFIDESGVFTNLQFTDSVNLLKGKSPYVAVYNKSDYTGYETLDDWLANYQEVLNAAGFKEERVIMAVQFDKDEFALSYSGDNESIRNIVENELKPSVQKEVEANEVIGGIDAFYDLAAEKLAGVSGLNNENSTNEGDAILADLETELKEKANEFKKIVMIVIIALVVILVFFVILIVFAVRASKKKKQNQAAMQYQANPMYPQNQYDNNAYGQSGAGYGQGYDNSGFNQGNMNNDQGHGYGQGYDNSGFAQGNMNYDQAGGYGQGYDNSGFAQGNMNYDQGHGYGQGYDNSGFAQGNMNYDQGAGYGQGYDNSGFAQGNMNYDQVGGYGQGYDNSGFAQGNMNNDQGGGYGQGYDNSGFAQGNMNNDQGGGYAQGYDNSGFNQGNMNYDQAGGYGQCYDNSGFNQGNMNYDQGAGYGQGYDNSGFNQGNMNYDQGTGYGQGYDNSGFAQGNVNNDQGAAYNQGFQPDGFGYSDGFGQEKKNDME